MRYCRLLGGRRGAALAGATAAGGLVVIHAPAALAFPHVTTIGRTTIYSDQPIDGALPHVIARADRLLAMSPINEPGVTRTLVLTDGGWRWQVLAVGSAGAIALRRPFSSVLLFNRSDVLRDRVTNGRPIGGVRTLSGTIAHETVHLLTARHIGEWRMMRLPTWKREGYADVVAGETSLGGDADERAIRASNPNSRVLVYYAARRRVAVELARNGGSVDALFSD